jgi:hypothetical protein
MEAAVEHASKPWSGSSLRPPWASISRLDPRSESKMPALAC